jgi:hypothetical protein
MNADFFQYHDPWTSVQKWVDWMIICTPDRGAGLEMSKFHLGSMANIKKLWLELG